VSHQSPEKAPVEKVKKARANISNLPKERLEQIRENNKSTTKPPTTKAEDIILGPADNLSTPAKLQGGKNRMPQRQFFAAWDDADKLDIDFTTEQVLAETGPQGTFDVLAERGYETLLEYSEDRRTREKLQDYEM